MFFFDDFIKQWQSLTDYIVSHVIKNLSDSEQLDQAEIKKLYKNETLRWTMAGQYQAEWLESLRKSNQSVADKFEEELKSFTFSQVDIKNRSTSTLCIGGATAVGAGVGFGITKLIGLGTILTAVGTAAIGIVGLELGKTVSDKLKKDVADKLCSEYKLQLQAEGEKLLAIVKQADN